MSARGAESRHQAAKAKAEADYYGRAKASGAGTIAAERSLRR
jgi:hypothetical protein